MHHTLTLASRPPSREKMYPYNHHIRKKKPYIIHVPHPLHMISKNQIIPPPPPIIFIVFAFPPPPISRRCCCTLSSPSLSSSSSPKNKLLVSCLRLTFPASKDGVPPLVLSDQRVCLLLLLLLLPPTKPTRPVAAADSEESGA